MGKQERGSDGLPSQRTASQLSLEACDHLVSLAVWGGGRLQAIECAWSIGFKVEYGCTEERGPTGHYLADSREPQKRERVVLR